MLWLLLPGFAWFFAHFHKLICPHPGPLWGGEGQWPLDCLNVYFHMKSICLATVERSHIRAVFALICSLRFATADEMKLHKQHLICFLPLCCSIYNLNVLLFTNIKSPKTHLLGSTPVWCSLCSFTPFPVLLHIVLKRKRRLMISSLESKIGFFFQIEQSCGS